MKLRAKWMQDKELRESSRKSALWLAEPGTKTLCQTQTPETVALKWKVQLQLITTEDPVHRDQVLGWVVNTQTNSRTNFIDYKN